MTDIDKLISEGEQLERFVSVGSLNAKRISGPEYEEWAPAVVLFLEENYPGSKVTEEARRLYSSKNRYLYNVYERLLGAIRAAKKISV